MDTKFWGPSGWKLLHYMTESYPDKPSETHKANMITFFNVLGEVLPCKYCRISFKEYIKVKGEKSSHCHCPLFEVKYFLS